MEMEPVDISIEDNRKYADVAFLIDKDSFLTHLQSLRNIFILPVPSNGYSEWIDKNSRREFPEDKLPMFSKWFSKVFADNEKKLRQSNDVLKWSIDYCKNEDSLFSVTDALRTASIRLCDRYKKNTLFIPVIEAAIVKNLVEEKDYANAFLSIFLPVKSEKDKQHLSFEEQLLFQTPRSYMLAFYFTPTITNKEIQQILKTELPRMKEEYGKIAQEWGWQIIKKDVITNIMFYRKWYWLKKLKSLSYNEIAKLEEKDKKFVSWDNVRQKIKIYRKLLSS
ncbi:MAG: hypothetical protein A3B41_01245 [Candidatus Levybacteria bacterium RIFCSPLOWO2_01_FULL_37_26]|nr:MAG: hypothetical protein A3E40_02525 [Candidatus Levybacteria bacterium RIFCSPHIGHO2_12_FULL_37_9]OGH39519.1 MAG: hypothetical protein A3B41_01245 [Candidatus Levybacteria bacterium RIFCSPLOWO2_01_FULL_37_26]